MEYINLKAQYQYLKNSIDNSVEKVMADARFIGGENIDNLEEKLAAYVGRKYCITCGSGTDALMLSYLAYGIGKGDAVFCPDMTFIASIEPACLLGAAPVFCDIDPVSYNISPAELRKKINEVIKEGKLKPKAVVMVEFLGNPADYDEIHEICDEFNLVLIEDLAQGFGSVYKGKKCGSLGDISCTSFFPSKPLGCYGDGGAVFTDDDDINSLIRSYKVHGKGSTKYDNVRIGLNSRLDNLQAAVLLCKFSVFENEITKRQEIAKKYDNALSEYIQTPKIADDCRSAYAQYVLLANSEEQRTHIIETLKQADIPSILYYPKELHNMDAFNLNNNEEFPETSKYAHRNFGIPFSPYITEDEQDKVIDVIIKAITK